jgi:pimeloyl-ACP methyl ester carboxylesterase
MLALAVAAAGCAGTHDGRAKREPLGMLSVGPVTARRVILLHGTPGSAESWADFMQTAPPDLHTIAIDRPGYGKTAPGRAETRLDRQSAALESLLPSPTEPGAILVGHSLGAAVAADAAARFPDRVAAIVLAGGSLDPDLERVYWIQRFGNLRAVSWLLPRMLRHANAELIAFEAELRSLEPRLARVSCPVIVVHGTKDRLVPDSNVDFVQEHFIGALHLEIIRLDGAGHFLPWNEKRALWDAVRRAIRASDSSVLARLEPEIPED